MDLYDAVRADIDGMAHYWMERKATFLDWTSDIYSDVVDPPLEWRGESGPDIQMLYNMSYTEWLLFECPMRDGQTPLELYLEAPSAGAGPDSTARLREVSRTQFFSRFEILDKDAHAGVCRLRDVRSGDSYEVIEPVVSRVERWRDGTIATRLGCVEGVWMGVGQMHLYDRARPAETAEDGPGEFHPEDRELRPWLADAGYYLRLMRDVLGIEGRYSRTMRAVKRGEDAESRVAAS